MVSVRSALAMFLAGAAACDGQLLAQTPTRSWSDANGYSWQEGRYSSKRPKLAAPAARQSAPRSPARLSRFGPFLVLDARRAVLSGATDGSSPSDFNAMLAAYPGIAVLEMRDCPGTLDDVANLRLGRMIRANGITTVVPEHGSVRSGAVDLFIAGQSRKAAQDADFGVHAWQDQQGLGPRDFAMSHSSNRMYLDYYRQMGMHPDRAVAFYNLTNAVSNENVIWLSPRDLNKFISVTTR